MTSSAARAARQTAKKRVSGICVNIRRRVRLRRAGLPDFFGLARFIRHSYDRHGKRRQRNGKIPGHIVQREKAQGFCRHARAQRRLPRPRGGNDRRFLLFGIGATGEKPCFAICKTRLVCGLTEVRNIIFSYGIFRYRSKAAYSSAVSERSRIFNFWFVSEANYC